MSAPRELLYQRLPAVYRRRDREVGEPLRALLMVLESELERVEADVEALYDDLFLDTCSPWAVPYLARLLGVEVLGEPGLAGADPRVQVARALGARAHKGTVGALERRVHDVTGWWLRTEEAFEHLAHAQHLAQPRPGRGGSFDVRSTPALDPAISPFFETGVFRGADLRPPGEGLGRINVPNLALALYRLRAYPIEGVPAVESAGVPIPPVGASARGFRFDSLGRDLQLFNRPAPTEDGRAGVEQLPVPITRELLAEDLERSRAEFFGPERAIAVEVGGRAVDPHEVSSLALDGWGAVGILGRGAPSLGLRRPGLAVRFAPGGALAQIQLGGLPAGLASARERLRAALRGASGATYRDAAVEIVDDRLLVLPGVASDGVEIDPGTGDAATAGDLRLAAASGGREIALLLSGALPSPLALPTPRLQARFGTGPAAEIDLGEIPADLAQARRLLAAALAARFALPAPQVEVAGDRLLVLGGDPAQEPSFSAVAVDGWSLDDLGLGAGSTVVEGWLSGLLAPFPILATTPWPRLRVSLGAVTATLRFAPPRDLGEAARRLEAALRFARDTPPFRQAHVLVVGPRLLVLPGVDPSTGSRPSVSFALSGEVQTAAELKLLASAMDGARGVRARLSAALSPFPMLRQTPRVEARLRRGGATVESALAVLEGVPETVEQTRAALERALRRAGNDAALVAARVVLVERPLDVVELAIVPGRELLPGESLEIVDAAGAAPATATALRLTNTVSPPARLGRGLLSGKLEPFPVLRVAPAVSATLGNQGPIPMALSRLPGDFAALDLAALAPAFETALRAAHPAPSFRDARVTAEGNRLRVVSGVPGERVVFAATPGDAVTLGALGLDVPSPAFDSQFFSGGVAVDPVLGRVLFAPGVVAPGDAVTVSYAYGFAADLGGGPYDRRAELTPAAPGRKVVEVHHAPGQPLQDAIDDALGHPDAVVRILDSAVYREPLRLDLSVDLAGAPRRLRLEAASGERPVLKPLEPIEVIGGGAGTALAINGLWIDAEILITGSLELELRSTTLVPRPGRASLGHAGGDPSGLRVRASSSVLGALRLPTELAALELSDSIVDAGDPAVGAVPRPALVSATLPEPLHLSAGLELAATLGGDGPRTLRLARVPADLAEARELLAAALAEVAAAGAGPAWQGAEVEVIGSSLLVRAGVTGTPVVFAVTAGDDRTVAELRLATPPALALDGLFSGDLSTFRPFTLPRLRVTLGAVGPQLVELPVFPSDLADAAARLEAALAASVDPGVPGAEGLTAARVLAVGTCLLIIPGIPGATVTVEPTSADPQTALDLALVPPAAHAVSGVLTTSLVLPLRAPRLEVTITAGAGEERAVATLADLPRNLDAAAVALETAIRAAVPAGSPNRFDQIDVLRLGDHLLVRPETPTETVSFAPWVDPALTADPTAAELALTQLATRLDSGWISAPLTDFPRLTRPAVAVAAPPGSAAATAFLEQVPRNLESARELLERALRSAAPGLRAVEVLMLGRRLLATAPSVAGLALATVSAVDPTAAELGLDPGEDLQGWLSGVLPAAPELPPPRIAFTLGGNGPHEITLLGLPLALDEIAPLLERALQRGPDTPSFRGARVVLAGDRLLVLSGVAGEAVIAQTAADDLTTVADLRLTTPPASLRNGLLSGLLFPFPQIYQPRLALTLGGVGPETVTLALPLETLEDTRAALEAAIRKTRPASPVWSGASVRALGNRLLIAPGLPVTQVTVTATADDPDTVAQLGFEIPPAVLVRGLLSQDLSSFPSLPSGQVRVQIGAEAARIATLTSLPVDLDAAAASLQTAIRNAGSPPVPASFSGASVVRIGDRLLATPGGGGGFVQVLPLASGDPGTAADLGFTSADARWGLLSGDLASFPALPRPRVDVSLGGVSPRTATFADLPLASDRADAAARLQTAIRAAASGAGDTAYGAATVTTLAARLVMRAGIATAVVDVQANAGDTTTASELALRPPAARAGLLSGDLSGFTPFERPQLRARLGTTGGFSNLTLAELPANLADAAAKLESALVALGGSFSTVRITVVDSRLVARSTAGVPTFTGGTTDTTTAGELQLVSAAAVTARISGSLASFPTLTAPVAVTYDFGGGAAGTATFASAPTDLATARSGLENALRAQSVLVSVLVEGSSLVVIPWTSGVTASFSGTVAASLKLDAAGSTTIEARVSGSLASFPVLSITPEVRLAVGGGAAQTVRFTTTPQTLAAAAATLETLLDPLEPVTIEIVEGRLLVRPATAGRSLELLDPTGAGRPQTATRLGLTAGAGGAQALVSGDLSGFGRLSAAPRVEVDLGGSGARTAIFDTIPPTLAAAAIALQTAIRGVASPPATYSGATVLMRENRLLVVPGTTGHAVVIAPSGADGTAAALRLGAAQGAVQGLLGAPASGFSGLSVALRLVLSLSGEERMLVFPSAPANLTQLRDQLRSVINGFPGAGVAFREARVELIGNALLITPGGLVEGTAFAIEARNPPSGFATAGALGLLQAAQGGSAQRVDGLLSGTLGTAPVIETPLARLLVSIGGEGTRTAELRVPLGLGEAATRLQAAIRALGDAASPSFGGARVLAAGNLLLVLPGDPDDDVAFTAAPGTLDLAAGLGLGVGLAAATRVLESGILAGAVPLAVTPAFDATLGGDGPQRVFLRALPRSLAEARVLLEQALREVSTLAAPRPAFRDAQVRLLGPRTGGGRLVVRPGAAPTGKILFTNAARGPLAATLLGLDDANGRRAEGRLSNPLERARAGLEDTLSAVTPGTVVTTLDDERLLVVPVPATPGTLPNFSAFAGYLSADLEPFPALGSEIELTVTLGGPGQPTTPAITTLATLPRLPQNLEQARDLLETALQQADPAATFTGARVVIVARSAAERRLLVLPGRAGDAVSFGQGTLATALGLRTGATLTALLGPVLGALSDLTVTPRLEVALNGGSPRPAWLEALPEDVEQTRALLQSALRAAGDASAPELFAIEVRRFGDRLLVLPGSGNTSIDLSEAPGGPDTLHELGLGAAEREPAYGLLSGKLEDFTGLPGSTPAVELTLGDEGPHRVALGGLPADVAAAAALLEQAIRSAHPTRAFFDARVSACGDRLVITPGRRGETVRFARAASYPEALARLGLETTVEIPVGSLASGELAPFPVRGAPRLEARLGGVAATVALGDLPHDPAAAAQLLESALHASGASEAFANATVELVRGRLLVRTRVAGQPLAAASIVFGPAVSPIDTATVRRLRLDPESTTSAEGLLSGDLAAFPGFSAAPLLQVAIGAEGPFDVRLSTLPRDLGSARVSLEQALRAAHNGPAFRDLRVVTATAGGERRLVVLSGNDGEIVFTPHPQDGFTAAELGLVGSGARPVRALLSGPLPPALALAAPRRLSVTLTPALGTAATLTAAFGGIASPAALDALAAALQTAIRNAGSGALFDLALAAVVEGERLLVAPGEPGAAVSFGPASDDAATVSAMALLVVEALAASEPGEAFGPPVSLERCTVFGRLTTRELVRASEVLFADPVVVERRQVGNVRYCFVPDGSRIPRRFRCQPDLALDAAFAQLERASPFVPDRELARERGRVLARLVPLFVSTRFGDPGYARLSPATASELLTGAEDGSEIGVYQSLHEPRRREQLRALVDAYVRFGLEAAIFEQT